MSLPTPDRSGLLVLEMYEALSLRFDAGGAQSFELYTHYMYEKIFGESFVTRFGADLEPMRQRLNSRFEVVPDAGHVVYLEQPDVFFGSMLGFIAQKRERR